MVLTKTTRQNKQFLTTPACELSSIGKFMTKYCFLTARFTAREKNYDVITVFFILLKFVFQENYEQRLLKRPVRRHVIVEAPNPRKKFEKKEMEKLKEKDFRLIYRFTSLWSNRTGQFRHL